MKRGNYNLWTQPEVALLGELSRMGYQPVQLAALFGRCRQNIASKQRQMGWRKPAPVVETPVVPRAATPIQDIQNAVAEQFNIPVIEMTSPRRVRDYAWPRQYAMLLARSLTRQTLPAIGKRFGNRDHTTIIHGIRAAERRIAGDEEIAAKVAEVRQKIVAQAVENGDQNLVPADSCGA